MARGEHTLPSHVLVYPFTLSSLPLLYVQPKLAPEWASLRRTHTALDTASCDLGLGVCSDLYSHIKFFIISVSSLWHCFIFCYFQQNNCHHHHQLNVHFLPRLIKGMDGCFPTAFGRQSTFSNILGPLVQS